ncbi:aldehyde dehydrogenase family protein [Roseococcus sp. SDR]|uniref:aldehyde dehydrogenase family protein n=1 Tax=Roseococcus sp. SDR TaxID=2835532 RepID=UPI001BCB9A3D|nr:aldehyde dehydrogenase family protein [Roseococcus sp. SDR]MBS7788865.1 aldehyde dehydrogenase family protein [Roseococcus sp. SDR]MBV1844179.1 aldehyde dehydrogenase family protein [Roseococcus sp. SDR]
MTPAEALAALRAVEAAEGAPSLDARRALLAELRRVVLKHAAAIAEAAAADYGARSAEDTLLADVLLIADACSYSRRKLRGWARPRRAAVPMPFFPARAWVEPMPKGVIGIMAPWNYPVQLALMPALDAIAAGNRVVIKPSEAAPRVAALIETILAEAWGPRIALVVQGGPEVAQDFASQPWDHLVFTGGTEIGRKVMAAAAPNLTPLTLELGGKCPALVLPGADLKRAARNILVAKAVNAGQTCIAPDTVLLIGHSAADFARAARESGVTETGTAVINARQQARLDRISEGATIAWMGPGPHSVGLALAAGQLAEEEIFGPILAMEECASLEEALAWVRARPHPLAIYLFGANASEEAQVAAQTKSGALVTGRAVEYAALPGLGFGGVGASGFGRRNGEAGFREFSNPRARMRNGGWALARLFDRPQTGFARKLIRQLVGLK